MEDIVIESMTPEDLLTAHAWTELEDWNVTLDHNKAMYDADPSGFFVARKNSKMVGCIVGARHEDTFGCLGLLIVAKDHRGQGIARVLMNEAIRHLGMKDPTRNCFLSGRLNMAPTYMKYGFKIPSWDVVSYFAKPPHVQNLKVSAPEGLGISPLEAVDRGHLVEYDQKFNLTRREPLLNNVFSEPGAVTRVGVLNGQMAGFGTIQPAIRGYRIAPLYADSPSIARALIKALIEAAGGAVGGLCVDTISENLDFQEIATELNMTEKYRLKRLYTQYEVKFPTSKVYGVMNTDVSVI